MTLDVLPKNKSITVVLYKGPVLNLSRNAHVRQAPFVTDEFPFSLFT